MKTKISKLRISTSFIVLFFLQLVWGQENYLPGYVIPLAGDTLHGFIDYRNWSKSPEKIFFKENLPDERTVYYPIDLKAFKVSDELYFSAITETNADRISDFDVQKELLTRVDTIFVQTKLQGRKSLYYYKNNVGKDHFYIKDGDSFELLIYKKYLLVVNGIKSFQENKKYLGQIMTYLSDCSSIPNKLQETQYTQQDLLKLFDSYYKCTRSEAGFVKKLEKFSNEFGVVAGASLTSLKFAGEQPAYLVSTTYGKSANFSAGLFWETIMTRNQKKWALYNELLFTSYKVDGTFVDNSNIATTTYSEFGYSYLKLNTMLRFRYPVGALLIFVNAGMSNGYALSENYYSKKVTSFRTEESNDKGRRYEQGFNAGVGTKFKRFSFETRFEKGNGMSEYTGLKSTANRFYFLLGFRF